MTDTQPKGLKISDAALVDAIGGSPLTSKPADASMTPEQVFAVPKPAPGVVPAAKMAMDWQPQVSAMFAWAAQGAFSEGIGFAGYPYLAQLTQRAEYRRISEIIALEMTRKWITVTSAGKTDAPEVLEMSKALGDFNVQALFRTAAEQDGFFGRSQIFVDDGTDLNSAELKNPIVIDARSNLKGAVKGLRIVEPMWSYPGSFNSDNPLAPNFYNPQIWFVNGTEVHTSRLLTFVSRELPDMLKPAYSFGGLSMSQMAKPYVDNWLRTRQSVSDLIHAFSVMVLATDMGAMLNGGPAADIVKRAQLFTQFRDNRGLMLTNKETEELTNLAVPLGTLDALQAQSQEQMASVAGIPLVVLLGITPSGLNASSDGEIRTFYAKIAADQERFFRPLLKRVFDLLQLHLWGAIKPDLGFRFNPLWEEDEATKTANRKTQADTDAEYINAGVIDAEEVRERLATDDDSPYHGLDLSKVIEPPIDPAAEGDPDEEPPEGDGPPAQDAAWREQDHQRDDSGKFGAGGGRLSKEQFQDLLAQTREKTAARAAKAKELAASGRSVRLVKADGRMALVGPDMSKPGGFRVTRLDADGVPNGHVEYADMETALNDALREGYATREDMAKVAQDALAVDAWNDADPSRA